MAESRGSIFHSGTRNYVGSLLPELPEWICSWEGMRVCVRLSFTVERVPIFRAAFQRSAVGTLLWPSPGVAAQIKVSRLITLYGNFIGTVRFASLRLIYFVIQTPPALKGRSLRRLEKFHRPT